MNRPPVDSRRRSLLKGAGAALILSRSGLGIAHARDHALDEGWLATAGAGDGFAAIALGSDRQEVARTPSAVRLHGIEASPNGPLAVAVGRRPGHIAIVFDRTTGARVGEFSPGAGRVFSGHGRFSADGTLFLTNEIERADAGGGRPAMGRGMVAVRRVEGGFAIEAEWPSGGDGPHDLMRAGRVLVVANGGLEPNTPEARDAEVTGSGIALIEPASGTPVAEGRLPADLASLSLRHLARDASGSTVVAAQELLADGIARPLLFRIGANGSLTPFEAPDGELRALRGYVGSVAIDRSGRYVACASPRGGRISVWRADGRYLGAVPLTDGCGLAETAEAGRFIAASGYGETILVAASDEGVGIVARSTGGPRFDNHMVSVTGAVDGRT